MGIDHLASRRNDTRRFSDRMLALMESVDLPVPQAGEPGSADRPA